MFEVMPSLTKMADFWYCIDPFQIFPMIVKSDVKRSF